VPLATFMGGLCIDSLAVPRVASAANASSEIRQFVRRRTASATGYSRKSGSSTLAAPESAFGDNKFQLFRSSPYG
jgi:hypothetical protein